MREIVERRNLRAKTFDLGGGKRMLRLGIRKPLHYVNEQGQLEDIDLTPTLDRGQHFISKTPYKARIGRDFPGYRYTGERGTISAELVAIAGNPIARREPDYADKRFYWRGISLDTDCTIIPRNAGLAALVTLHSENAPRSFTWEVLGDKAMMRPLIGRDDLGRSLELEQEWNGDNLQITWTGRVIDGERARKGQGFAEPKYPVWIDPTVNEEIVAGADDASSYNDGTLKFTAGDTRLLLGSTGYATHLGLRFQTIAIPQGATIDAAILTLDVVTGDSGAAVRIYGNDVDDAAAWANPGNLMRNITKTSAFVNFSGFTATGAVTIGVTSPVQEIINRAGWASNNDLGIVAFPTGNAFARIAAIEHATRDEAQLDITYTVAGGAAARLVGQGLSKSVLLSPRSLVRN